MADWDEQEPEPETGDVVAIKTAPDIKKHLSASALTALADVLDELRTVAEANLPAGATSVSIEVTLNDLDGTVDGRSGRGTARFKA